jgi:hypothetical protein
MDEGRIDNLAKLTINLKKSVTKYSQLSCKNDNNLPALRQTNQEKVRDMQ